MELPNDLVYEILIKTDDYKVMVTLCSTNTYAYKLCHNDDFWQVKYNSVKSSYPISSSFFYYNVIKDGKLIKKPLSLKDKMEYYNWLRQLESGIIIS